VNEVPVTVIVPTLGRAAQLEACLASLAECEPRAAEVLIVDQSGSAEMRQLAERYSMTGARYLYSEPQSQARASNLGLRDAKHELVLFTDDDCTVERSWVATAVAALGQDSAEIVTGRVLAPRDAAHVPSTIDDPTPRVYAGELKVDALYAGNMAFERSAVLAIGGFDEQLVVAAADNDLCWRWLRAGRRIRYEPAMVVWHHDWRTPEQLDKLYVRYARGQGAFYGKHLRLGDRAILKFLLRDLLYAGRAALTALRRGGLRVDPWARGIIRAMPRGLIEGWRTARPRANR
jgi:GT2 family glycosyltransferase